MSTYEFDLVGNRLRTEETAVTTASMYCDEIITGADRITTNFSSIPAIRRTDFALGSVGSFRAEALANSASNDNSMSAWEHLATYSLARYLSINKDDPKLERRGFFSWNYVTDKRLVTDPDFDTYQKEDLAIVAYNKVGKVLGLLRISKPDPLLLNRPIKSSDRPNTELMEMEKIHGRFLDDITLEGTLGDIRILSRLSRVSYVEGIPGKLQQLIKAKITTHVIASAFATTQMLRSQGVEIVGTIFDGEKYATDAIKLLGLEVQQFPSNATVDTVPSELLPRYFTNNRSPVIPHLVPTRQLDYPDVRRLYEKIEGNSTATYARMFIKQVLAHYAVRI